MVVKGRHVERLAFLDILLGDEAPLTEIERFYQRMLSQDASEVLDYADHYLATHSLLAYSQAIAMNALLMAQHDVRRGALTEDRQLRIRDTMRDLSEDLLNRAEAQSPQLTDGPAPASLEGSGTAAVDTAYPADGLPKNVALEPEWTREGAVLCVAGRIPLDEAAAHLLADLLKHRGFGTCVEPPTSLTQDQGGALAQLRPSLVILSFLDADLSIAQARFAVRRLRRRIPDTPLATAFLTEADEEGRVAGLCHDVRADLCLSRLPEAVALCLERGSAGRAAAKTSHTGGAAEQQSSEKAVAHV